MLIRKNQTSLPKPSAILEPSAILDDYVSHEDFPASSEITLPDDITKISSIELRRMHGRVVAWLGYRQGQWGKLSARQVYLKKALLDRTAHLSFQFPNMEKWRVEHMVRKDKQCAEVLEELVQVEASLAALEMELEKLERRSQLLSREQSYRETELKSRL